MNGIFSINKKDVMKYPKNRYEKLLNQLSVGPNLEVAHYVERSWSAIFFPLLHTKLSLQYDQINNTPIIGNNLVKNNRIPMNINRIVLKRNVRMNGFLNRIRQNYLRSILLRNYAIKKRKRNIYKLPRNKLRKMFV